MSGGFSRVGMFRGGRGSGQFVPRNRREWKDAVRHVWFQLAVILGRKIADVRAIGPEAALVGAVAGAAKDRCKGRRLVRRLGRLKSCEPKPRRPQ